MAQRAMTSMQTYSETLIDNPSSLKKLAPMAILHPPHAVVRIYGLTPHMVCHVMTHTTFYMSIMSTPSVGLCSAIYTYTLSINTHILQYRSSLAPHIITYLSVLHTPSSHTSYSHCKKTVAVDLDGLTFILMFFFSLLFILLGIIR